MFRDLLQEAYGAMRHNRRRTALTMLGMAWGIATVVMLLAYGNGFGKACEAIFAVACQQLGAVFERVPLGIALEMQEIDPVLTFKKNNLHEYVKQREAQRGVK